MIKPNRRELSLATQIELNDDEHLWQRASRKLTQDYDIKNIGYDRWKIEDLANKFSQEDIDLGSWPILPIGQGFKDMSEPVKNIERYAIAGKLRHGGNPVLRWMVGNVVIDEDPAGNYKLNKGKAKEKIDGIAALANALAAWTGHIPEFRSRYEDDPTFDTIKL